VAARVPGGEIAWMIVEIGRDGKDIPNKRVEIVEQKVPDVVFDHRGVISGASGNAGFPFVDGAGRSSALQQKIEIPR
jgi:hypothetical protein